MRTMGIDIGTTTISVVMADGDSGKLLGSRSVSHKAFLKGTTASARIQDPEKLWQIGAQIVGELIREYGKPDSIGMTGQMHGFLYVDKDGKAISPFYTWQDGSGNEIMEKGLTYADVLREKTGTASAGYGLTTHFYLGKKDMIPETARKMTTISDYIGMKLCGRAKSFIAKDMAASWGCYHLKNGDFCRKGLEELGINLEYLPELLDGHMIIGTTSENYEAGIPEGIPVSASRGDNQASVLGAVRDLSDTILVNIGTGSQVSFMTDKYLEIQGAVELRPCTKQYYLMAGSSLCGGRAYAMLEHFYREAAGDGRDGEIYDLMEKQARKFVREYGKDVAWKIRTTFSGTRSNPEEMGSIEGINVQNFHPGAMTIGMIQGILEELYEMYERMCRLTGRMAGKMVGSGNGIRRNSLLREMAEEMFHMPLSIPECEEEAAYGAALGALVSSGYAGSLDEVQQKIRYL